MSHLFVIGNRDEASRWQVKKLPSPVVVALLNSSVRQNSQHASQSLQMGSKQAQFRCPVVGGLVGGLVGSSLHSHAHTFPEAAFKQIINVSEFGRMLIVESISLPLHSGAAPAHPLGAALGSVLASGQHLQVSIMVSATQASPPLDASKAVFLVRCLVPSPCWPQVF